MLHFYVSSSVKDAKSWKTCSAILRRVKQTGHVATDYESPLVCEEKAKFFFFFCEKRKKSRYWLEKRIIVVKNENDFSAII